MANIVDKGEKRVYLGDGVYADFDGYHILLAASNGEYDYANLALEPDVYSRLRKYAKDINDRFKVQHFEE